MRSVLLAGAAASALILSPFAFAAEAPATPTLPEAAQSTQTSPGAMNSGATAPMPDAETAATPAPPTMPQQQTAQACQAREATVYFGVNSTDLSAEAQSAVTQAANASNACAIQSVTLTGFTDARGDAEYNRMLAERRSEAVRDILIERGIPETAIQIEAMGEAQATGDAARDRRVEVEITLAQAVAEPADQQS